MNTYYLILAIFFFAVSGIASVALGFFLAYLIQKRQVKQIMKQQQYQSWTPSFPYNSKED